ncbi:MAG TPA: FHA domain-containing protein [Planctomycetaceae bacterium]|nr:FHA domain-containing protein [Planctomycetaceae bacterium]
MARLVLLQKGEAKRYELTKSETLLGRHPDCDIQLGSNTVSRRHAKVIRKDDVYYLEDLGSGNGTYVNGKRITERVALKDEDRVKLGPFLLRFETDRASGTASKPAASGIDGVAIADDADASVTIVGDLDQAEGFGALGVQPEAKLKAVLEISRSLAGTVELESLLPRILDSLFHIFPYADRGCILLKDQTTGKMIPRAFKHRREGEDATVRLSRTILKKVLAEKKGILSADASSDAAFRASESIATLAIRSMMCVPMLGLDGEPRGVIHIDTQNPIQQFKKEDLDLLMAVAGQAALSYENARLMDAYVQKQKQDNEMEIARNVQRAMLPESLPEVEGYEFYASYHSAQAVGGDYYDAFMLDDHKICLSFGDVAGKGVPGAIIMARIASCVQNTMGFTHDVGEAIQAINNHMCQKAVEGRFVTYLLIVLDVEKHEMSLVNAGHMSPMILKPDGELEEIDDETIGLPIGVVEDYPYDVVDRAIAPGEIVVLFTDGVDEAMNPAGELYTLERMRQFIRNHRGAAAELGEALLADVRRHADGRPQNDDITIMTFGRNRQ